MKNIPVFEPDELDKAKQAARETRRLVMIGNDGRYLVVTLLEAAILASSTFEYLEK